MGQRYILTDDMNEDVDAVGTLQFFVDGQEYEIDLGEENMTLYKDALESHRKLLLELADYGRPVRRQAPLSAPRGRTKDQLDEIRRWARANGYEVKNQGRIPEKVIDAYETRNRVPVQGGETGTADGPEKNPAENG